jgi:hypothetical protein
MTQLREVFTQSKRESAITLSDALEFSLPTYLLVRFNDQMKHAVIEFKQFLRVVSDKYVRHWLTVPSSLDECTTPSADSLPQT